MENNKKKKVAKKMSENDFGHWEGGKFVFPPGYVTPTQKFKKEQKMFNSAKREINRLKKQGK